MKKCILIAIAATSALACCAAKLYEWPQLPMGTLPDSEVSTNVTLHVNMSRLDEFSLCIEASNCVSNEVLVAIGHDADEDGDRRRDIDAALGSRGALSAVGIFLQLGCAYAARAHMTGQFAGSAGHAVSLFVNS